jgi:hypothetical protein
MTYGSKMIERAKRAITVDLTQFKLHIHLKSRTEITLHFDSPSRRFYLSVIALVLMDMKRLGQITSIPLEAHADDLKLLNETIGDSAGSSDNLIPRIYRKWKGVLPDLENAPLFKVVGRKKEEDGGSRIYRFSEAEKDTWANLFEYKGSEEHVRLRFSIDTLGMGLNDAAVIYGDATDNDAWERFIGDLSEAAQERPPQIPETTFSSPLRSIDSLDAHYAAIAKTFAEGRVVPFLGEGANLCGRPAQKKWQYGQPGALPSNAEVAEHLAQNFEYPPNAPLDLVRVSQYVSMVSGSGPLYDELHTLFDTDYQPTPLHHYFAALPAVLRDKGYQPRYPLIVTTNYDDALERAFREVNEPFDLVAYVAEGEQRGKFLHIPPDGAACVIERPNEYRGLSLGERSVILKIHGAVDRVNALWDSFVITEDDYISYLVRTDVSNLLPVTLAAKLRKSHFLFLGYGLRDWNLRVILHRIWGEQKLNYKSWAIQGKLELMEKDFWRKREVDVFTLPLEEYIAELEKRLKQLPGVGTR